MRLLLIAGNIALFSKPWVLLGGRQYLLFDVGGILGIAGISFAFVWSLVKHAAYLYHVERLP